MLRSARFTRVFPLKDPNPDVRDLYGPENGADCCAQVPVVDRHGSAKVPVGDVPPDRRNKLSRGWFCRQDLRSRKTRVYHMPRLRPYHLFISHSWTYSDHYSRLTGLLQNAKLFNYKNYSVPKDDPIQNAGSDAELRAKIQQKMKFCTVVFDVAGIDVAYRKWIRIELVLAKIGFSTPKPVLAIKLWGNKRNPKGVVVPADMSVAWIRQSTVNAISRLAR